jgi:hypothetical protein
MNDMNARIKRWGAGTALAAVLALTFMTYLRPAFMLDLANRLILCF